MTVECERAERDGRGAGNFRVALQFDSGGVVRDEVCQLENPTVGFKDSAGEVEGVAVEGQRGAVVKCQRSGNSEAVLQLQIGAAHVQFARAGDTAARVQPQGEGGTRGCATPRYLERFIVGHRQRSTQRQFRHHRSQAQGMAVEL